MNATHIAGVVLAAGASRRLGTPKQLLLDEGGQSLVARAASQLLEAGCRPVVVVLGAEHDAVADTVAHLPVHIVINAGWAEGMGSSIRVSMDWLEAHDDRATIRAVLVTACDIISASSGHFRAIIDTSRYGLLRVASEYNALSGELVHGIPALFPVADWTVLRALQGDRGARDLFAISGTLSVFLLNGNLDLDTPADVDRWRAEHSA